MKKNILLFCLLILSFQGITQSEIDTITASFFGFDFWSSNSNFWRDVYLQMDDDTFPFGLVGSDAINWHKIEPNPPKNGKHHYNWQELDPFMQYTQQAGKVLELGIRPASNWGTVVKADDIDNWALGMSPILSDKDSDTLHWGMTAQEAYYDFIYNLIERYDGDGDSFDAPWVNTSLIKTIVIGNEPESPTHFFDYGGSMKELHNILSITYDAVKDADESVIVARGKSNSGRIFDDSPDYNTITNRGGYYLDSLLKDFELGGDDYDVFAINYNDHYTQLPGFVDWLKKEMAKRGGEKSFIVSDARTTLCPRDNYYKKKEQYLPPVYSEKFMLTMENPNASDYKSTKEILQKDEVMQSIKKVVMATFTGQKQISLQPVYSNLVSNEPLGKRKYMWYYSGFFDPYIYDITGNLGKAREPLYWSMKKLANQLIGCETKVERIDIGENIYLFKYEKRGEVFFIAWHEDNFAVDSETGLRKREQNIRVDLRDLIKSQKVKMKSFYRQIDSDGLPILIKDTIIDAASVSLNEFPIMIFPETSTNINDSKYKNDNSIFVYPNPFINSATIEFNNENNEVLTFKMFDSNGNLAYSLENFIDNKIIINRGLLKAGIYYFYIIEKEKMIKGKLIIL